jgi:5-methylcytosine-specific restriction endonuclease McrA
VTTDDAIEKERARKRAYYHANAEKMKAQNKAWRKANPEAARAIRKAHYARRAPGVSAEISRKRRLVKPEENRKATRAWRAKNRERHMKMVADWGKRNKVARQVHSANRRARKSSGAGVSKEQWAAIKAKFSNCCAYCLQKFERLTMDHVVPLATGGAHEPDNIVPACITCNRRKHIKPATAFAAELGRLI